MLNDCNARYPIKMGNVVDFCLTAFKYEHQTEKVEILKLLTVSFSTLGIRHFGNSID